MKQTCCVLDSTTKSQNYTMLIKPHKIPKIPQPAYCFDFQTFKVEKDWLKFWS